MFQTDIHEHTGGQGKVEPIRIQTLYDEPDDKIHQRGGSYSRIRVTNGSQLAHRHTHYGTPHLRCTHRGLVHLDLGTRRVDSRFVSIHTQQLTTQRPRADGCVCSSQVHRSDGSQDESDVPCSSAGVQSRRQFGHRQRGSHCSVDCVCVRSLAHAT